jgi:hypothetical protein
MRWGDKAIEALLEELQLFLKEEVLEAVLKPMNEQLRAAPRAHCFIVKKRDGRIKSQAVADGRTQKRYLEEETYSLTIQLKSIMLSSLIGAYEEHQIIMADINGAFRNV